MMDIQINVNILKFYAGFINFYPSITYTESAA